MTRGRCAKGLCSEYGAKLQAKRSGIYETQSVILSETHEDTKQKRESHFQVRGVEVLRSEYGAKPQAKRSGIYEMIRYNLPDESNITPPRDPTAKGGRPTGFGYSAIAEQNLSHHQILRGASRSR